MPDCHLCRYNGHPTTRCFTCKGPSNKLNQHGIRFVNVDLLDKINVAMIPLKQRETAPPMTNFMHTWLRLPPKTRDLIARFISTPQRYGATKAYRSGLSRVSVHRRLIRAVKQFPELRAVLKLRMRGNMNKVKDNNI